MNKARILYAFIALSLIITSLILPSSYLIVYSSLFTLISSHYKSSAGTDKIYPGSRSVELVVEVKYVGSDEIYGVTGCLDLSSVVPAPVFTISRGHSSCSAAYDANNTVREVVKPGDIIIFKYYIDVSDTASPGTYRLKIDVNYKVNTTTYYTETVSGIEVIVSDYPPITLEVIDYYWSPDAYPGSEGVTLNIVLENRGDSTVISGHLEIILPDELVISSRSRHIDIGVLNKNDKTTISIPNIDINVNADPNKNYEVTIRGNITARTDDGVVYNDYIDTTFYITVDPAPKIILDLIDYGVTTYITSNNTKLTRIYILFQNKDTKTINSITSLIELLTPNTTFINGTNRSITIVRGPYGYGDYITIQSNPIILNKTDYIELNITLTIFGSSNGAEFWSIQNYILRIELKHRKPYIDLVEVFWDNGRAFPGSADKTLNIVLLNNDVVDVTDSVVKLVLPEGFNPRKLVVEGISIGSGRYTTIRFTGIDIDQDIKPGKYLFKLIMNGVVRSRDNSYSEFNITIPVIVEVYSYEKDLLRIVSYGWTSGRAYTTSTSIRAYIEFLVNEPVSIMSVKVTINLPPQLVFEDNTRKKNITITGNYRFGQTIRINTEPIDVVTANPGITTITFTVEMLVSVHGSTTWITRYYAVPLRILKPRLNITLIDATWVDKASQETYGNTIHLVFQSLSIDNIEDIVLIVKPSVSGVLFSDGRNISIQVVRGPIGYGDIVSSSIRGVEVRVRNDKIPLTLELNAIMRLGEGYYKATETIKTVLYVRTSENLLVLSRVETLFRGEYSPLLPSAKNIVIRVTLLNVKPYAITAMKINATAHKGLVIKGVDGTCPRGVNGGSTCTLNLHVDVDKNMKPGIYPIVLNITYIVRANGATNIYSQSIGFNVVVDDVRQYLPKPMPIEWYWGTRTPTTVFEYNRDAPLTIIIYNPSRYTASGVVVRIKPLNNSVSVLKDTSYCGTLAPGTTCSNVFYLDLANTSAGIISLNVLVEYLFRDYGVHIADNTSYEIVLRVERYAGGKGLEVVSYGWANNWPVYPQTENATYTITIANRWPYPISGILVELEAPKGFSPVTGRGEAYIPGPIQSLNTFTATFTLNIGDVEPGTYPAKVKVDYVVETGGARIRVREEYNISIIVNSLKDSITLLEPSWLTGSPEPGTHGAVLIVRLRNNYVPSINGPVLEVKTPPGIYCSLNNESYVILPPVSSISTSALLTYANGVGRFGGIGKRSIEQILSSMIASSLPETAGATRFDEGDIIEFNIPLNLLVNRTGVYYANATLNFIDQWGNVRRINFTIPIRITGSAKVINIWSPRILRIINGTGELSLTIVNDGSSPVYNVYIYLIPKSSIALPVDNVKYMDTLYPGKPVNITFTLRYNPTSIAYGTGGAMLQYSSLPLIITILYRDVSGKQYVFNTSTTILIEPFIDIRFSSDVKAELRGGVLIVSGTLVNYGLSPARSVEVRVIAGNNIASSFIGDVDPASQSAFRVELNTPIPVDTVRVEAVYRDEYNILHIVSKTLPVTIIQVNETTTTVSKEFLPIPHLVVVAAVIAFLGTTALLLYRYLKKHGRRLEETMP